MSFLATDGGPHPADRLAAQVARQVGELIAIDENSTSDRAVAARKQKPRLVLDIADAVEAHHDAVMRYERAQLRKHGTKRLSQPLDPRQHAPVMDQLENAVGAVKKCAEGTVFAEHFKTQQVHDAVRNIIGSWFATAMDIERDWIARGHSVGDDGKAVADPAHDPGCPHVRAWRAKRAA